MVTEKPWRAEAVLQLLLWLFVSMSVGVLAVQLSFPDRQALEASELKLWAFVISAFSFHGVGLILVAIFLRSHQIGWAAAFGFDAAARGRTMVMGALVAAVVLPVALLLAAASAEVMIWFDVHPEIQPSVQSLQRAESPLHQAIFGLVAVLIAPLVEELLFRGILYPTIKRYGYPRLAWWGTSLLFAVMHGHAVSLVPLLFLSLVLIWLYEKTGNLLAPIVTHGVFNGVTFYWVVSGRHLTGLFVP